MFTKLIKRFFSAEQTTKQKQGVYWEKGALQGCYIIFQEGNRGLCIGSEKIDGPSILIESDSYIYLCVQSANNGCTNDYYVVEDYNGPFKMVHSGYIYECGGQRIRLL